MPTYSFGCPKCQIAFDYFCRFEERKNVKCPECSGEVEGLITMPLAVTFKELKGTSKEDNFEYVAKTNFVNAQMQREAAEKQNKGSMPYRNIDDSGYEGKIV